jgi:hypothetical protein
VKGNIDSRRERDPRGRKVFMMRLLSKEDISQTMTMMIQAFIRTLKKTSDIFINSFVLAPGPFKYQAHTKHVK